MSLMFIIMSVIAILLNSAVHIIEIITDKSITNKILVTIILVFNWFMVTWGFVSILQYYGV